MPTWCCVSLLLSFIGYHIYLFNSFTSLTWANKVLDLLSMIGVHVGHQFYSRAEMVAVGFHSHWLNGIDYMGMSYKGVPHFSLRFGISEKEYNWILMHIPFMCSLFPSCIELCFRRRVFVKCLLTLFYIILFAGHWIYFYLYLDCETMRD